MLPLAERIPPPGHPYRFSTIAHSGLAILGPMLSAEVATVVDDALADLGDPVPSVRRLALDIGCGKGDLLVRLALRGVDGIGLDRNPWFLADADAAASAAGVKDHVEWRTGEVDVAALPDGMTIAACVGATDALGGPVAAPRVLARLLPPGGIAVIGELYWKSAPPLDAAAAFGTGPGDVVDLDATIARIAAAGLVPVALRTASQPGWDAYEAAFGEPIERWAQSHPHDADRDAFLTRARLMRTTWLAWRRAAMGFVVVVARRPGG